MIPMGRSLGNGGGGGEVRDCVTVSGKFDMPMTLFPSIFSAQVLQFSRHCRQTYITALTYM